MFVNARKKGVYERLKRDLNAKDMEIGQMDTAGSGPVTECAKFLSKLF